MKHSPESLSNGTIRRAKRLLCLERYTKEGIYHIQHINAFHNNMKDWMYKFRGVATNYLDNYIYCFKWLQYFNTEKDIVKSKQLFVQASTIHSDTKLRDFKTIHQFIHKKLYNGIGRNCRIVHWIFT